MKALKKVVRGVTLAELWATALTFVIMVVCYFISVVNRNFIKGSMPWTEELALYCMVYMALIGTELGLRDGTQVSVTALTEKLKGTMVGKVINFIILFTMYFSAGTIPGYILLNNLKMLNTPWALILPNCISVVIISTALQIPNAIFTESFLSFLGLGVNAPMPSLGSLASDALNGIYSYTYRLIIPAVVICLIVLSLNLFGDGLRDAFDPKLNA